MVVESCRVHDPQITRAQRLERPCERSRGQHLPKLEALAMRRLARFGVCGSCIFENGAILQPVMIPMSLDRFSRADRVKTPRHHIDPGFVNHRLIFSTLGHDFREFYERRRLKSDDHMSLLYNDHLLVTYLLNSCHEAGVPTLGEVLQSPVVGSLFCSTELLNASPGVYGEPRSAVSTFHRAGPTRFWNGAASRT